MVIFEETYLKYLHLKVQELTKDNIIKYVTNKIPENLASRNLDTYKEIPEEILEKSEGVSIKSCLLKLLFLTLKSMEHLSIQA